MTTLALDHPRIAAMTGHVPTSRAPDAMTYRACPADSPRIAALSVDFEAAWNRYVEHHPAATICHTLGWKRAVEQTFGHQAHYLIAEADDGRLVGVLPLFLVRSALAGRMLVSVPYATTGGVLADNESTAQGLHDAARNLCDVLCARVLELRSVVAADPTLQIIEGYAGFRRELPNREDDVLGWLPRKARAAARRAAEKHPLTVEYEDANVNCVWDLYSRSMRRLASPNYPLRFFRTLLEQTPGRHDVQLVRCDGRPAAGLITFYFAGTAMPYFVGNDERVDAYGLNNYLYWQAMQRAVQRRCRVYDFGRTRCDNTGPYDFKRFHGFEPTPLGYQRYVPAGGRAPDLRPSSPRWMAARAAWRRLPLSLTRWLGARLAHSIPG